MVCIAWSARSVHLIAAGVQEGNAPGLIVERIAAPSVVCSALVICPIKKGPPSPWLVVFFKGATSALLKTAAPPWSVVIPSRFPTVSLSAAPPWLVVL